MPAIFLEQRRAEMIGRAGPGRRIDHLAGIGFRVSDELRHSVRRHRRVHHHGVGHVGEQRQRGKILHAVERHGGEQSVVHGVHAHGVEQNGVAVGCRACDRAGTDVAGGAGAVLDHDRLAHRLVQMLADDARQDVGRSAGRPRHDQRDRTARIGLREGGRGGEARKRSERGAAGEMGHGASLARGAGAQTLPLIPAHAGIQSQELRKNWVPAFAGTSGGEVRAPARPDAGPSRAPSASPSASARRRDAR